MGRLINQEENYAANFGAVFRSSAIFYKPPSIKTTITFSNYWKFKNNLDVGLVYTIRTMTGELVSRKELTFEHGNVLNIEVCEIDEGSIEVEAFSSSNLRIPYAAIIAVYEDKHSISMVHSYGRNHSLIELEDDKGIVEGCESCWTIRASRSIKNTAVFHNGHIPLESQTGSLIVTDYSGQDTKYEVSIPALGAFQTHLFCIEDIVPEISKILGDGVGWATIHFTNQSAFTRLLVSWRNEETNQYQVTHSNFDYTSHTTNQISSEKPALMVLPTVYGHKPEVIVYPKFSVGQYSVTYENGTDTEETKFENGLVLGTNSNIIAFRREDNSLPARIVTAISGSLDKGVSLPFECSLGVIHEKRPPKRFHWLVVSKDFPTTIYLTSYSDIYSVEATPIELVFRLYTADSLEIAEKKLRYNCLEDIPGEFSLRSLFESELAASNGTYGYVSLFSPYGGFFVYSSLKKEGSVTLEHSF